MDSANSPQVTDFILVRAAKNEGVRVFQEEHPDHPNGSVDVWGNEGTHSVAVTDGIRQAIEQGILQQVGGTPIAEMTANETRELPLVVEAPDPNADVSVATIPNYDDLTVDELKTMARQLTPEERDAVRRYEVTHLNRKTLLAALDKQDGDIDGIPT